MLNDDQNTISFVACPNHDTNVGWNKLRFIRNDLIRCDLCKKEFTLEEIKEEVRRNYNQDLQNLAQSYANNLASLNYMSEKFGESSTAL